MPVTYRSSIQFYKANQLNNKEPTRISKISIHNHPKRVLSLILHLNLNKDKEEDLNGTTFH